MHIENVTINIGSGPSAMSQAFIAALLRGPELNGASEPEAPAPATGAGATTNPPRIGEYWIGQGGIYCGLARGEDGQPDSHLILSTVEPEKYMDWNAAIEWAKTVSVDGHTDFTLPSRFESALLYANVRDKLKTDCWHWTGTQCSESYAWGQLFYDGTQDLSLKKFDARVRLVRRFVL